MFDIKNVIQATALVITQILFSREKAIFITRGNNTQYPSCNTSTIDTSLVNVSDGIISIFDFYTKHHKSNSEYIYVVDKRHKNILDAFGGLNRNIITLDVLKEKSNQQEHTASYHTRNSEELKSIMKDFSITRLLIIAYRDCNSTIISTLRSNLKKSKLKCTCNSMYKDQVLSNLPQLLEGTEIVLLLLSALDANVVLERMLHYEIKEVLILTTGIPVQVLRGMEMMYSKFNLINLPNSEDNDIVLDTENVAEFLQESDLNNIFEILPMFNTTYDGKKSSYSRIPLLKETWRVASIQYAPYCIVLPFQPVNDICVVGVPCLVPDITENDTKWNDACCSGMAVDLLKLISNEWKVKFELYIAEDGLFGGFNNGTWDGIINEVYSDNADIGIQGITPTAERSKVVDFSESFQYTYISIIRRTTLEKLSFINYEFLEPLDNILLVVIIISSILLHIMLFLFENVSVRLLKTGERFAWRDVFSYTTGLIFQRDIGGRNPVSSHGRLSALSFAVCMTVIMSTYTAKLTANGINNQETDDFLGIIDPKILKPTAAFTFGTVKSTSLESFFQYHSSNRFRRVYHFMKPYSVSSEEEGVKAVLSGKLDAFITESALVLAVTSRAKYCFTTQTFIDDKYESELAFAVQKKSSI
ncbi:uncharacterized protein LOC130647266 [Hydractinia symbiolongicarpus]|uniref:uncharacterized protein LOC130647266 n=1 Tax=Hydractinia symbiolongicarpus TaxID=13093 RepID=UPI00254A6E4F|nr:uncharacterized protein LOC130647266 [Hydractinia symbiolongicarpus]